MQSKSLSASIYWLCSFYVGSWSKLQRSVSRMHYAYFLKQQFRRC